MIMNNITITGNVGGSAVGMGGVSSTTINNSNISSNSGSAISNQGGNLTVNNSSLSGNSATGNGGAIYNDGGNVTINNSTISGNSASGDGAAIYNITTTSFESGEDGASDAYLYINNSTIAGNTSANEGGGIWNLDGRLSIANSTLSANSAQDGGGIYSDQDEATDYFQNWGMHISSTIVAGNTALLSPDIDNTHNDPTIHSQFLLFSLGNNLIGNTSGCIYCSIASDQINLDPLLNPLANNGGGVQTMSLKSTSPAIGMAHCNSSSTDERGVARKTPFCDVGAYETAYNYSVVHNTNDAGLGSLRLAVMDAPSGTTVTFDPAVFSGQFRTITLTSGGLTIANNQIIQGSGANYLVVDGNHLGTVFTVNSGVTATISGLTIQNGNGGTSGGGIDNAGTLTLTNCWLSNNSANSGGGLKSHGGSVTISGSTFSGNSATTAYGGGLYTNAVLTGSNSTFSGNSAALGGGGLYVNATGTLTVGNSTVSGNSTSGYGGGIYNYNGTLNLGSTIIAGNTTNDGPDIYGAVTSLGSNLVGNISGGTGLIASDQQNSDPLLNSLNYNGGLTQTMPPQVNSPAIGMGNCALAAPGTPVSLDQRGQSRKTPNCDAGAYETTYDPVVHNAGDSGGGSLRYAVTDAPPGTTITFNSSVFNTQQTILLDQRSRERCSKPDHPGARRNSCRSRWQRHQPGFFHQQRGDRLHQWAHHPKRPCLLWRWPHQ